MKRSLSTSLALLFVLSACSQEATIGRQSHAATVCALGPTTFGIDVSKWQGTVDWSAVRNDGVEFAFIRVSDGINTPDNRFQENWAGAKSVGILRGAYQFFRPSQDPIAQAQLLLDAIGPLEPGDLPPVIDVEVSSGLSPSQVASKVAIWIDHVENALGVRPIIYTASGFWNSEVQSTDFSDYPLWIAHWGPVCPTIPNGWDDWLFFQDSETGSVDGISGDVDTNLFHGSIDDLLEYATNASNDCARLPSVGGVIDDSDSCFTAGGKQQFIRSESVGFDGDLKWTHTTSSSLVGNFGLWRTQVEAGSYRITVHIPQPFARSQQARYVVSHAGSEDSVMVDQSATDGWIELGTFDFTGSGGEWVRLDDNTGEENSTNTKLAFDAIALERVDLPGEAPQPGDDESDDVPPEGDDDSPGAGPEQVSTASGCSTGGNAGGLWLLALVALVAVCRSRVTSARI